MAYVNVKNGALAYVNVKNGALAYVNVKDSALAYVNVIMFTFRLVVWNEAQNLKKYVHSVVSCFNK